MTTNRSFSIIANRRWWYLLSLILIIPGVISLLTQGLNVGIDFRGGTLLELEYSDTRPSVEDIRSKSANAGIDNVSIQTSGERGLIVRFPSENGETGRTDGNKIIEALNKQTEGQTTPTVTEKRYETIGGAVARDTTRGAIWAVIITSLAIIAFISWSFAGVPKPASAFRFGVTAIVALLHDLLFVIGAFSILGALYPTIEVDALFITALLTILGFSVNDTIVVFDRIRENLRRRPDLSFEENANESLNQTLVRSLNTSLVVLLVLVALLILGGSSIRSFVLALTLGIAIGTYSSIFNASPLLVSWQGMADRMQARKPVAAGTAKRR
jgi:preprotein translocase subunit SecF